MGQVIQMFKTEVEPTEEFVVEDLLTEEMDSELHDVIVQLTEVFEATSERHLQDRIRAIKEQVRDWPSG